MLNNKNKTLKLTLVIPVYNEQNHLEACLASVAKQTFVPYEVIVVDNNSTDSSIQMARNFPFVSLVTEKKQGVLYARTRGFDKARGDIIARIDADTMLPPRWCEKLTAVFEESKISAVTGPVYYYDMPFAASNHHPDHFMRHSIYNWSPKSPFLFGSNMAIRRSAWEQVKADLCSHSQIHEDLDLAVHLFNAHHIIHYTKDLLAGASGRRYNDSPAKFYRYLSIYRQTYLQHGMHSLAIYSATGVYAFGYIVVHPWLSIWYRVCGITKPLVPFVRGSRRSPNW